MNICILLMNNVFCIGDCEQTPGIENVTKPSTSGIKTSETPVLNIAFNKR